VSQKNTYTDGHSMTNNGLQNNRQGTSNVTFKGEEDLGGGLKASFLAETDFDSTTNAGTSFANAEVYAGLAGSFGSIKLGAPNTPSLTTQSAANPFGTKIGGGFGAMNTGRVRNPNSIVYATPSFNGFSAVAAYANQTKSAADVVTTGSITDIGLFYANGPLAVGYSNYKDAKLAGGTDDVKQNNAYVTYDLGTAKLGAGYYTEKSGSTVDSKAYNVSVAVPMGAVTLMANYGKKDDKVAASNNDRTVTGVGAKYALSKRTSVYARLVSDKIDNQASSATTVAKSTYTIFGLQHNF